MQAWCRVDSSGQSAAQLPSKLLVLFKTQPRLAATIGSRVCIKPEWQLIDMGLHKIILVHNAFAV